MGASRFVAESGKSKSTKDNPRFTTVREKRFAYATGGATPRMSEKSDPSYSKPVSGWAQANNMQNQHKERTTCTMGSNNEYVTFNTVLDQYVVDKALIRKEVPPEKQEALLKYCETSCRFKNRDYGKDSRELDAKIKYYMDHLDPDVLKKIQMEILRYHGGKKRFEIPNFEQKVLDQIEEIYRVILGNGKKQLAIKRAYREAYPYLQGGVGPAVNLFDPQMPFDVIDQIRAFHIRPHHIRIYRMLIAIQDPMKSKLFTMDDLEESIKREEEYFRSRMKDTPPLMIVTRPDSIALVKKHIHWFTDEKEFILHNIPLGCKYGTITTPDKTVYRILLSNNIHRQLCPKAVPEDKAYIYTDWEKEFK